MSTRESLTQRSPKINTVQNLDLSKARRAIEYFIFSCSNTLKEPLNQINYLCSLIAKSSDSESVEIIRYVEDIMQTVQSMEYVVRDLQQFLAHAHNAIAVKPIEIDGMIKEIVADYRNIMLRENIHLTIAVDQPVPFYTDQSSFRMILNQLISNAVKFSDESKARKEISVMVGVSKSNCRISVKDNGIGIDSSIKSEIFKLFFRRPEASSGSGVGLFIAKELSAALGSEIKVRSKAGEGTEFYFETENLWQSEN